MDDHIRTPGELACNLTYARSVVARCRVAIPRTAKEEGEAEFLLEEIAKMTGELDAMRRFLEKRAKLWQLLREANDQ